MFDLNMLLGLALIVCAMGWAVQLGFTAYWRDRCSDLQASIRPPRRPCDEPARPAPQLVITSDDDDTLRIRRPRFLPDSIVPTTVPGSTGVMLLPREWPIPRPFAPPNLATSCKR
jgi:hypothetical protein